MRHVNLVFDHFSILLIARLSTCANVVYIKLPVTTFETPIYKEERLSRVKPYLLPEFRAETFYHVDNRDLLHPPLREEWWTRSVLRTSSKKPRKSDCRHVCMKEAKLLSFLMATPFLQSRTNERFFSSARHDAFITSEGPSVLPSRCRKCLAYLESRS